MSDQDENRCARCGVETRHCTCYLDGYDCCQRPCCPGTCERCGFSTCEHAADNDRCDCRPEERETK